MTPALAALPPWLVPPAVFVGLLAALWLYKCAVTVLFQGKIVYMPYMPPFTRGERVEDYAAVCRPVGWEVRRVRVEDGVDLRVCVGVIEGNVEGRVASERAGEVVDGRRKRVVICYFHGNGGSLPPRLPMLSGVLRAIHARQRTIGVDVEYTLVALSYRGYWTSTGKPSQPGLELDAQALLRWVNETYGRPSTPENKGDEAAPQTEIILWGQSIGAGVATTAATTYARSELQGVGEKIPIAGLVLETPFTSVKRMLLALYPQKWLPYRYLWPFLRSHWDSEAALRGLAASGERPEVLILAAGKDEVVPAGEAEKLEAVCRGAGLEVGRGEAKGALHTEATSKREGREAVAGFVIRVARRDDG